MKTYTVLLRLEGVEAEDQFEAGDKALEMLGDVEVAVHYVMSE